MRQGRCKNAQADIGGQQTQKLLPTGREGNKECSFSREEWRSPGAEEKTRLRGDTGNGGYFFAGGQNIRGIIRTACRQSWKEDREQTLQEETGSKAERKSFGARKKGSARTRNLSGQIGSYSIEKRHNWNY